MEGGKKQALNKTTTALAWVLTCVYNTLQLTKWMTVSISLSYCYVLNTEDIIIANLSVNTLNVTLLCGGEERILTCSAMDAPCLHCRLVGNNCQFWCSTIVGLFKKRKHFSNYSPDDLLTWAIKVRISEAPIIQFSIGNPSVVLCLSAVSWLSVFRKVRWTRSNCTVELVSIKLYLIRYHLWRCYCYTARFYPSGNTCDSYCYTAVFIKLL